jgi:hypothetical protein
MVSGFRRVMGLGSGLTPSGDDLIAGFLLAASRYKEVVFPNLNRPSFYASILEIAYQKTSLLSANLIECASQGQADERLVHALDGIMAGSIDPATSAQYLLGWGNSSGGDAFLGMALAAYPAL